MSDGFAQGLVGVTLDGRYRLDAVLGEGGMGSVFRATQLAMDRKVAVKLLKPHLTSDVVATERFNREARATLKVDSPHAVKVLDFGVTPLGDYYMVLEYLDGRTVQRELEIDGVFAPARVAHIARQALHALGVAHAQGLIHRDVKPDNLLLMRNGADADYTKILDFGVAKLMQNAADPGHLALTAAGMVFGTPEFMSPEQACGQPLDGRSDLYSLAATMFVMLTGTTPFEAGSPIEWLTHHVRTPPPQLAMVRPELAAYPELDALMQRCLAKQREQRPATAAEMAQRLAEIAPALARNASSDSPRTPSKPTQIHSSSYFQALDHVSFSGSTESMPMVAAAAAAAPASVAPRLASRPGVVRDDSTAAAAGIASAAPGYPARRRDRDPATSAAAIKPRRRGRLALWLAGAAVASLIGVAIGVSVQQAASPRASADVQATATTEARPGPPDPRAGSAAAGRGPSAATATASREPSADTAAASREPPADTAAAGRGPSAASREPPADTAVASREPPADTAAASREPSADTATTAGSASSTHRARPQKLPATAGPRGATPAASSNPEAEEHLRAAEEAARDGSVLRQQGAADAALRADPTSARAKYLLGDALIKGDAFRGSNFEKGCKYLGELKRMSIARERARSAGCPGN